MEEFIAEALESLRSALDGDPRVKALEEAEKELLGNEEVIALAKKKDAAESDYELALKTNSGVEAARKRLYEAKLALDTHPVSKRYNEAYIAVRDLYMEIDDILIGPYRGKILMGDEG
jgi:cell fate (sporulation/competence/biofilm development) regulator YlbF (YheA/YmcA/DUF963 family)